MHAGCSTYIGVQSAGPTLLAGLGAASLLPELAQAEIETNKSVISVRGLSAFQRSAQRNYLAVGHFAKCFLPSPRCLWVPMGICPQT